MKMSEPITDAAPAPDPTPQEATDPVQVAALIAERDQLAAEKAELTDRNLRMAAEFQNFRRRAANEKLELVEYAASEIVRQLLPVLDDFERALKVESPDKEYARGTELIYQRLFEALKKAGLEPVESMGKKFDPHLHHAVEMVPTEDLEDHTILEEYQRGYNFKGRQLRPAMVKVAVRP